MWRGWGAYLVGKLHFLDFRCVPGLSEVKVYVGLFVWVFLGLIMASSSPFLFSLQILHVPPLLCSLSDLWPLFLYLLHVRTNVCVSLNRCCTRSVCILLLQIHVFRAGLRLDNQLGLFPGEDFLPVSAFLGCWWFFVQAEAFEFPFVHQHVSWFRPLLVHNLQAAMLGDFVDVAAMFISQQTPCSLAPTIFLTLFVSMIEVPQTLSVWSWPHSSAF